MRVLLTGGTGFVGRHLVKGLISQGYKVGCLVRDVGKAIKVLGESVEVYRVNFEDKTSLEKAFEEFKPEFLIHLIGILFEDRRRGQTFMRVHYLYSKSLYQVAKEYGGIKKVVHMSSLGTHKEAPSLYHRTKYMAEEELKRSGLHHTIIRPSLILGPEQKLFYDLWHITKYIRVVALPAGGNYLFQPVDVRDVVCAFVKALEVDERESKVYELCGSVRISFRKLLEDVFEKWGRRVFFIPMPKSLMYAGGLLVERLFHPPPFSSDQMLMMWRDNVCGLDPEVESKGVQKLCGREPINYEASLGWCLEEFKRVGYA
ncbi:MAG: NAD-dependent epimerase/dehydratase family protein [Aquificaceae bacterium]|nr:NAD-dependent epimerase/dehydratase family protein [Aquificaceae bacterium]